MQCEDSIQAQLVRVWSWRPRRLSFDHSSRQQRVYGSLILLSNRQAESISLDLAGLKGYWLAATLTSDTLDPPTRASAWLVAISAHDPWRR